jgi:hypothetical protein
MKPYKQRNYVAVSAGSYAWVPVDHHSGEFNVGYAVFHNGTGQVSANIDGTLDDIYTVASCKAFFLVTANASTGLVSDGNITQPVMAMRYRVAAVSGSANVSFRVQMGGA